MSMGESLTDDLRRRLQRLEDLEEIKKLKARYLNACDLQDPERAKNCFAEGPVLIDMGHVGVFKHRDEFAALYKAAGCQPYVLDMHQGANPEIDFIDEHHAKALWSLDYRNFNTRDKTATLVSLKYHDEYAKIDGEWKITKSVSDFRTALHCSYASGRLDALLVSKSLAPLLDANAVR
jgi:hypothetical protein